MARPRSTCAAVGALVISASLLGVFALSGPALAGGRSNVYPDDARAALYTGGIQSCPPGDALLANGARTLDNADVTVVVHSDDTHIDVTAKSGHPIERAYVDGGGGYNAYPGSIGNPMSNLEPPAAGARRTPAALNNYVICGGTPPADPRAAVSESCATGLDATLWNTGGQPVRFTVTAPDGKHQFTVPGRTARSTGDAYAYRATTGQQISVSAPNFSPLTGTFDSTCTSADASLVLDKSVDSTVAGYGDRLTYTLVASARGTRAQTDVLVTDRAPAHTSYVPDSASCVSPCTASYVASSGLISWRVGNLEQGPASPRLTFAVTVIRPKANADGGLPAFNIPNAGLVSSTQTPTTSSNTVITSVVAVLGEKVTRSTPAVTVPGNRSTPASSALGERATLPFTGPPVAPGEALGIAAGLVCCGALTIAAAGPRRRARPHRP
ncbi:MAG TPA: hypothetical protein VNG13_06475 [Mycobacteriales bacterium]|nr:hypothetical protein [Mycobacteriales bacterium]